ncbi:MAG: tetratricopeptide repeat protein [Promethearchaeota archaeon]
MLVSNLTIEDLFSGDEKFSFLIGAGCSIDKPSCLAAGREMMKAIINFCCAESEISKISELEQLRFEQLVEYFRNNIDENLKIIDYYGLCDKPNLQHFFLADMIKKGHFVITTNFDYLIEQALLQSGVPGKKILPVITESDFRKFYNPDKLYKEGRNTIYKIHGSTKNIITDEDTRESLVATIQAFGSGKEGESVFQVEPYKRPLFENFSNGRSLVVMGYSGSDDFDIVPTLKVLEGIHNIIWINFIHNISGEVMIHEIDETTDERLDKVNQILVELYRMRNAQHIYRVNANTPKLIGKIWIGSPDISKENFDIKPRDWLENNMTPPSELIKYRIPYLIYSGFDMYEDALRCANKVLDHAKKLDDQDWVVTALNNIGQLYTKKGEYDVALQYYNDGKRTADHIKDLELVAECINEIGNLYYLKGMFDESMESWNEALKINKKMKDEEGIAINIAAIARVYSRRTKYKEALTHFNKALEIYEKYGNLKAKATILGEIANSYYKQQIYEEAVSFWKESLMILDQLGNISKKATLINNIGKVHEVNEKYDEALKSYEEALDIATKINDGRGKLVYFYNIGNIVEMHEKNYSKALEIYERSLKDARKLGDLSMIGERLSSMARIQFGAKNNLSSSLELYHEALEIYEKSGELMSEADTCGWIALIYDKMNDPKNAIQFMKREMKIKKKLGYDDHVKQIQGQIKKINETGRLLD